MATENSGAVGGTPPPSEVTVRVSNTTQPRAPPRGRGAPTQSAHGRRRERSQPHHGADNDDDQTANPRPLRRSRHGNTSARCCNCCQTAGCTNAPQSTCACRRANRVCTSCRPFRTRCTNCDAVVPARNPDQRPIESFWTQAVRQARPPQADMPPPAPPAAEATPVEPPIAEAPPADEGGEETDPAEQPAQQQQQPGEAGDDGEEEASDAGGADEGVGEEARPTQGDGGENGAENPFLNPEETAEDGGEEEEWVADEESKRDLEGVELSEADRRLIGVYGDTVHLNDGRHLRGGIAEGKELRDQHYFDRVVAHPHRLYFPPRCAVGKRVVKTFADLLRGVRERKWNSEVPMIFLACILRRNLGDFKAAKIKRRINQRLDLWDEGKVSTLVSDIESAALMGAGAVGERGADEEKAARAFNSNVLDGRVRSAVRNLTARTGGGGVLDPDSACTKTGRPVIDVLRSKHPEMQVPDLGADGNLAYQPYESCPETVPLQCDAMGVEAIASKLSGAAGLDSVDAAMAKAMLTAYGRSSAELREELVEWAEWLANTSPPWAAYRAMMSRRLAGLDKQPGVRPVGIGCIWLRYIAKLLLMETAGMGRKTCGALQLCAGLEAGIEGGLHSVFEKVRQHGGMRFESGEVTEEELQGGITQPGEEGECGVEEGGEEEAGADAGEDDDPAVVALVDADNGFCRQSKMAMLWDVRHRWAPMARFTLNTYRHYVRMVVRVPGQRPHVVLAKEGCIQGDPISMFLYGIGLLPLAEKLRAEHGTVACPFFADDLTLAGKSRDVAGAMKSVIKHGPSLGYFAAAAKSWVICAEWAEAAARDAMGAQDLTIQYTRGHRYVGGFVGSDEAEVCWIEPQVKTWVQGVESLAKVALRYPQSAYTGLVWSLQAEWQYFCRVCPRAREFLGPVEAALREKFLPALLGRPGEAITDDARRLYAQGAKQGGLAIRNPVETAPGLHEVSKEATTVLVGAIVGNGDLDLKGHRSAVKQASSEARKERVKGEEAFLKELAERLGGKAKKRLVRSGKTSFFLTRMATRLEGTQMSRDEWFDNIAMRYGWRPRELPQQCDGCGANFSVEHALGCKKGGLVTWRHNDVRDEWAWLCGKALPASSVGTEPLIFYGANIRAGQGRTQGVSGAEAAAATNNELGDEARGDVSVRGFHDRRRTVVFDIRVTNTDAPSYGMKASSKVLEQAEKDKCAKYERACQERQRDFVPLVYSVDGLAGKRAAAAEKTLAALLSRKWERPYSDCVNFVRVRMQLAVIRSTTLLLRTERDKVQWTRRAPEESAACLGGRRLTE